MSLNLAILASTYKTLHFTYETPYQVHGAQDPRLLPFGETASAAQEITIFVAKNWRQALGGKFGFLKKCQIATYKGTLLRPLEFFLFNPKSWVNLANYMIWTCIIFSTLVFIQKRHTCGNWRFKTSFPWQLQHSNNPLFVFCLLEKIIQQQKKANLKFSPELDSVKI